MRVVVEWLRASNPSSGVSDQQSIGLSPVPSSQISGVLKVSGDVTEHFDTL